MSKQEFHSIPVRTAKEIVDQTEELAALLMLNLYQREKKNPETLFRDSECPRAQRAWKLACEVQALLTNTDPEDALSELEDEVDVASASATASPAEGTGYLVLQEGGSSSEMYGHGFDTLAEADDYRRSCADDGSYRTSPPVAVPLAIMDHPLFHEIAQQIANGAMAVDYPDDV